MFSPSSKRIATVTTPTGDADSPDGAPAVGFYLFDQPTPLQSLECLAKLPGVVDEVCLQCDGQFRIPLCRGHDCSRPECVRETRSERCVDQCPIESLAPQVRLLIRDGESMLDAGDPGLEGSAPRAALHRTPSFVRRLRFSSFSHRCRSTPGFIRVSFKDL
jgi:hypothetical protein